MKTKKRVRKNQGHLFEQDFLIATGNGMDRRKYNFKRRIQNSVKLRDLFKYMVMVDHFGYGLRDGSRLKNLSGNMVYVGKMLGKFTLQGRFRNTGAGTVPCFYGVRTCWFHHVSKKHLHPRTSSPPELCGGEKL